MDDATLHAVEQRLTRLERANRRWTVAVARAVLGLDKGRPVLDFLDETGKTVWKAP